MTDWERTILPRGHEDSPQQDAQLRTSYWLSDQQIIEALGSGNADPKGESPIILGQIGEGKDREIIAYDDDRHAVVIAGSRSGKGVSLLIPNALSYPGSLIVTDFKGELAATTALWRKRVMGQDVCILDPFNVLADLGWDELPIGRFNPLEWLDPSHPDIVDDVGQLADAMMVKEPEAQHFYEMSRSYLKAVMLYLYARESDATPDLSQLRELAMTGEDRNGILGLIATMMNCEDFRGAIARSAGPIFSMGDREYGSVVSTVARNTEFLDSYGMAATLSGPSSFNPKTFKSKPTTVYLILPERRMATHHRWLRLVLTALLNAMQLTPKQPKGTPAVLMMIDEFPTLGHMEPIERAAGYIAGFGCKLMTVIQDLSQLKAHYRTSYETFLGNAGIVIAFGNTDITTAEYLSKRCGEAEVLRIESNFSSGSSANVTRSGLAKHLGEMFSGRGVSPSFGPMSHQSGGTQSSTFNPKLVAAPLLTPDEIPIHFARETGTLLTLVNGARPMRLDRIRYWDDPLFSKRASPSPFYR